MTDLLDPSGLLSLGDLAATDPAVSGGKAAGLARLARGGVDVPAGFVIPTGVFRRHLRAAGLDQSAPIDLTTIQRIPLDEDVIDQLGVRLGTLGRGSTPAVAVRSSATTEDGAVASAAGQHDSVLAVTGAQAVSGAVLQCWSSLWSDRAQAYRVGERRKGAAAAASQDDRTDPPEMAVLVQAFVDADVSGVLFTGETTVIEATPGLGDQLVSGEVTPDSWAVGAQGISDRTLGTVSHRSDRDGDRLTQRPLSRAERERPCLTDAQVHALTRLGHRVSTLLGGPTDLEWAITGDQLHVLQARPVTAALPTRNGKGTHGGGVRHGVAADTLHGIAASPGTATGPVRVITSVADFRRVTPGDVLVCEHTDPAWTPLFGVAAAVVTEHGGLLSHAAIVAREIGLPAVVAVPGATQTLQDGATVRVDGHRGSVHVLRTERESTATPGR